MNKIENAVYAGYYHYRKSQVDPEDWNGDYEIHRQANPVLYWAGQNDGGPNILKHLQFLIENKAWPYLDKNNGDIALRDAVGALKRKMRKESYENC